MDAGRPAPKRDAVRQARQTVAGRPTPKRVAVEATRQPGAKPPAGKAGARRGDRRGRAGPGAPPDQLVLRSPAQFRALGHPLRHRLFNLLRQRPATLAQLAAALGSTKGTVGYHVQLMVDAGVVRLAGTRRVRGGTERYYEPVAGDLRHDPDAENRTSFLIQAALDEMLPHRPGDEDFALLRHVRLTPAEAREVAAQIERLACEGLAAGRDDSDDGDPHGLLFCLFKADIPVLPPDGDG
jgi:DNA-binding transcriptional ArsR family regulator